MTKEDLRRIISLKNDLALLNEYNNYLNKASAIRQKIFSQVLLRLNSFTQKSSFEDGDDFSENYFSPKDLFIEITPSEFSFLKDFRDGKV